MVSYVKRATIYFRDRRLPEAVDLLNRALVLAPEDLDVKTVLGLCLFLGTGARERATGLRYLEEVAARRPEAHDAQLQIGRHYTRRDPGRAITALELYLRHRPEERRAADPVAQVALGEAYLLTGRVDDAVGTLDAACGVKIAGAIMASRTTTPCASRSVCLE